MNKYKGYEDLLSKTYDEAVECLLQKYGPAQYDYFSEKSYQRFMDEEIKNITKGKYKRTGEGLYCHHIDEKKNLNISNQSFVKENNVSFEFQKKERLVYCDLIEHTILHVLITQETSREFGAPGYVAWLKPMIEVWYLEEIMPKPEWMKICYHKSFLNPEETVDILRKMQEKIGESYYNTPFDYHEGKGDMLKEVEERLWAHREAFEKEEEEKRKIWWEAYGQYQETSTEAFYRTYPKFKSIGIDDGSPRREVIAMLYEYKYKDTYKSKKALDLAMKPFITDKLLRELYLVVSSVENHRR